MDLPKFQENCKQLISVSVGETAYDILDRVFQKFSNANDKIVNQVSYIKFKNIYDEEVELSEKEKINKFLSDKKARISGVSSEQLFKVIKKCFAPFAGELKPGDKFDANSNGLYITCGSCCYSISVANDKVVFKCQFNSDSSVLGCLKECNITLDV